MANLEVLYKLGKRRTTPGSPGIAGSPGRPAIPGHYEYITYDNAGYVASQTALILHAQNNGSITADQALALLRALPEVQTTTSEVYVPPVPAIQPTPAVPATPTDIQYILNSGWNAGARSIQSFTHGGSFSFTITDNTAGCIVGLNNTIDTGQSTRDIRWGFYYKLKQVMVFELGNYIAISDDVATDAVFRITRSYDNIVTYYINDVLVYTSPNLCVGVVFLDVTLYAADL